MKALTYFTLLLSFLFFTACTPEETETLTSSSEDGEMIISVKGNRASSMDPYTVNITVNIKDKNIDASTEVYADKLDNSNVDFNWQSNRNCLINFTHRDGKVSTVPVTVQE